MNIVKLSAVWEKRLQEFYSQFNDRAEIHKRGSSIDTPTNYDAFFDEAMDPNDPSNLLRNPDIVYNVYGVAILNPTLSASNEKDKIVEIGVATDKTVVFTCLASDVNDGNGGTLFDGCDYVYLDKTQRKYKVKSVIPNGLTRVFEFIVYLEEI